MDSVPVFFWVGRLYSGLCLAIRLWKFFSIFWREIFCFWATSSCRRCYGRRGGVPCLRCWAPSCRILAELSCILSFAFCPQLEVQPLALEIAAVIWCEHLPGPCRCLCSAAAGADVPVRRWWDRGHRWPVPFWVLLCPLLLSGCSQNSAPLIFKWDRRR